MKILFVLVFLALIVLAVYFAAGAVKAWIASGQDKWKPGIKVLESGDEEVVLFKPGRKPIVIGEIDKDLSDLERGVERDFAWEEADKKAKEWNKSR